LIAANAALRKISQIRLLRYDLGQYRPKNRTNGVSTWIAMVAEEAGEWQLLVATNRIQGLGQIHC
jgi:hypothetical protein